MLNIAVNATIVENNTSDGVNLFAKKVVELTLNLIKVRIGKRKLPVLEPRDKDVGKCLNSNPVKFVVLRNLRDIIEIVILLIMLEIILCFCVVNIILLLKTGSLRCGLYDILVL